MDFNLTEMQAFALVFCSKSDDYVNGSYLGTEWHRHKHGRYPSGSSRGSFGTTSAAYRCLRKLVEFGLVGQIKGSSGSISFFITIKGVDYLSNKS